MPTSQGFDTYFGVPYSNDMTIDISQPLANDVVLREGVTLENIKSRVKKNLVPLMRDTKIIEYPADQNTLTKRYTEEAIAFIKKNKESPSSFTCRTPCRTFPLCDSFEGESEIGFAGTPSRNSTGRPGKFETLRKLKLDQNTLVIYTSTTVLEIELQFWVKGNMNRRVGALPILSKAISFPVSKAGCAFPP